jgi:hypothetical protein
MIETEAFRHFLQAAKRATYAAQGDDASVPPSLMDSKQLEYRSDPYLYRDIYFGMSRFVGQEVVYVDERSVWSMSYSGGLIEGVSVEQARPTYAFLRKALLDVPSALPLRGPASLRSDDWLYTCHCEGDLHRFHGVEIIRCDGALIYELHFSGSSLV